MNLPENFTKRMSNMLKEEYGDFIRAFENEPIYSGIRVNTLRPGAHKAVEAAFGALEPIPWCPDGYYADKSIISGRHPLHTAGVFYFQEPSAMCAAAGLPIEKGDRVLDLCAAPGGKSTQAGARLGGTGLLVANEIIRSRAEILSENIERMGLTNAIVTNEAPDRLAKKYPGFFDKIIVDAPCSGEGMFRKEPKAVTEWSIEHTVSCGMRQKNILLSALDMLRPGGMLMYSTCTFAPEENEMIAAWLLDMGMELCPAKGLDMLEPGRTEWSGSEHDMSLTRRIFPHKQRGEGHFAALFRKSGSSAPKTNRTLKRDPAAEAAMTLYRTFEREALNVTLTGDPVLFGDKLYLKPEGIDIDKIRVIRCGLWLGTIKKNRFEPSHSLAAALKPEDIKRTLAPDSGELKKYLAGEVIECREKGWSAVCSGGYVIGWGKCSGGMLKNHFPKGLRYKYC